MPTVSWRFSSKASLSLVPTPSVPRRAPARDTLRHLEQRAKTADTAQHAVAQGFWQGLDAVDQGIPGVDIDPGIAVGKRLLRHCVIRQEVPGDKMPDLEM